MVLNMHTTKGIKSRQRIRHEELSNSYDCGFENGKKFQATQIEGAYFAGRLQVQKECSRIPTVQAFSAIQKSDPETINKSQH